MESSRARDYDLVVWGATGFTGRLVVEELARAAPPGLRWAVAGRDPARLDAVRAAHAPDAGAVVADVADPASLGALARSARAVVTTVGPYARYGTPLVAACVVAGTHVADLTGEPTWMRATIERYDGPARAAGVRVVHACGFDSVPSDVGVWWLQQHALERFGRPCHRIDHVFGPMSGGISGGTVASALALAADAVADPEVRRSLRDPDVLAPGSVPTSRGKEPAWPRRERAAGGWSVPFPMAAVNERVVRRTRALLGEPWGTDFGYHERWRFGTWPAAAAVAAIHAAAPLVLAFGPARRAVARRLPPGSGPSADVRRRGHFRSTLVGWVEGEDAPLVGTVASDHDPGYGATARMLGAMGVGLAEGAFDAAPVGVVTPAVAGGAAYVGRLEAVGIRFRLEPGPRA